MAAEEERQYRSKEDMAMVSTPTVGGSFAGRLLSAAKASPRFDGNEVRGVESTAKKSGAGIFEDEDAESRFSRSSVDMEKAIEAKLSASRRPPNDKVETPKVFNNRQLTPSVLTGASESKKQGLASILKAHGTTLGTEAPSPSPPKRRQVIHHMNQGN